MTFPFPFLARINSRKGFKDSPLTYFDKEILITGFSKRLGKDYYEGYVTVGPVDSIHGNHGAWGLTNNNKTIFRVLTIDTYWSKMVITEEEFVIKILEAQSVK